MPRGMRASCAEKSAADVGAAGLHEYRVQRCAACHEQPVALAAAKRKVGNDFGHPDLADASAVRGEYVHSIVPVTDPAHARPNVAILVAANAVGKADLAVHFHIRERPG